MKETPALAFAAYSGAGKTTLMEKLVRSLKARGLRVAVIKHDGHGFEIDREGKDSWRFAQAGAELSILCSPHRTALIEERGLSLEQSAALVRDVDLILVEGFKQEPLTQIGVRRMAAGRDLPAEVSRYAAVVTDVDIVGAEVPCFGFDDIPELTEFILKHIHRFTRLRSR